MTKILYNKLESLDGISCMSLDTRNMSIITSPGLFIYTDGGSLKSTTNKLWTEKDILEFIRAIGDSKTSPILRTITTGPNEFWEFKYIYFIRYNRDFWGVYNRYYQQVGKTDIKSFWWGE